MRDTYREIHWGDAGFAHDVEAVIATGRASAIAELRSIAYATVKVEGGRRRARVWEHQFEGPAYLLESDPDGELWHANAREAAILGVLVDVRDVHGQTIFASGGVVAAGPHGELLLAWANDAKYSIYSDTATVQVAGIEG